MPQITIVYWRDIPAQIIAGKGRKATKRPLPERFEQAIDRCAMKVGARDADAYLADWRRAAPFEATGTEAEAAQAEVKRIEAEYDNARLRELIDNEGRA
jgi:hypothetical protein